MPNIRIKDIPTTASATSSTDFIGIDGSANGTRKLNAYSPTFGGNLTVSGTGSFAGDINAQSRILLTTSTSPNAAGQTGYNVIGGGYIWPKGGSSYDFTLYNKNGNEVLQVPTGTQNSILSGNLTVSGTDYNYVGGNKFFRGFTNYNVLYTGATELSINNQTDGANLASFKNNGNFLLGTNIDGGQKLQVSGTAAISGNTTLGSGNTYPIYSYSGYFQFATATSGNFASVGPVRAYSGTTSDGISIQTYNGSAWSESALFTKTSLTFLTNNTTALTLDSSQNATFQNTVTLYTVGVSSTGQNSLIFTGADGNGNVRTPAKIIGKQAGNGGYGNLVLQTAFNNSLVDALTIDASQNATFAGLITTVKTNDALFLQSAAANWTAIAVGQNGTNGAYFSATKTGAGSYLPLSFWTGDSRRMDIATNGAVLIGSTNSAGTSAGDLKVAGAIAIGNTVAAAVGVASTHKVTISIGGSTYYLLATNV